jgi:hypothetical protein
MRVDHVDRQQVDNARKRHARGGAAVPAAVQKEVAAENVQAATWGELWGLCFEFWGDACLDALDVMRHTALAALDGYIIDARQERIVCDRMEIIAQAQERNRQAVRRAEADHTGRLIRELFEEV